VVAVIQGRVQSHWAVQVHHQQGLKVCTTISDHFSNFVHHSSQHSFLLPNQRVCWKTMFLWEEKADVVVVIQGRVQSHGAVKVHHQQGLQVCTTIRDHSPNFVGYSSRLLLLAALVL